MTIIHVRQDGPRDHPVLVLIHGLCGSTRWWDPLVPLLIPSFHVIRFDLLGHGRSAKPAGPGYAIAEQADLISTELDRLEIESAITVGHSTGGMVSTALAERRPELVDALVLIDSGPHMDAFSSDGLVGRLALSPVIGPGLWRLRTDGLIRRALSTVFAVGFPAPQECVDDLRGMRYHGFAATSDGSQKYLEQRSLPDRLAVVSKPLMVIFGEKDRRWRSSSALDYKAVPGARVELLPSVGHSPMIENPDVTARLLHSFTTSIPQR